MSSALQSFLAEMKARPKMRAAIASGATLLGRPVTDVLDFWSELFRRFANDDDPLTIELSDEATKIVTKRTPFKERYQELLTLLEPHDPTRHRQ